MSDYSHSHVMKIMRALGYSFDAPGVCAGIAEMATQAYLCGEEEFAQYRARIDFIAAVTDPEELRQKIAAVKEVVKSRTRKLTEYETELLELEAFCEGILLYLLPTTYKETLGTSISQPKVTKIAPLVASKKLEELGGTRAVTSFPGIYTFDEMTQYAEMLQEMASRLPHCDLAFGLDSMNHRISLYYSASKGTWILNDANQLPPYNIGTTKELAIAMHQALALSSGSTKTIAFNTTLYSTNKNENNTVIEEKASFMKRSENYRSLHNITPERITRTIESGHRLAHLAAKFNHPEVIKELAGLNADLNSTPGDVVQSPLHLAASLNQLEVLSELLNSEVNVNAKDSQGRTPAFCAAIDDSVASMKLLIAKGADLNIPNNKGWKPIHIAARKDGSGVIEEIANSRPGADALTTKLSGQTPLWIAASYGSENAVRMLLQKLKDKKINVAAHVDEPDNSGVTALMKAAEKNSATIVAALIAAGADVNAVDYFGRTAAHYAAAHNDAAALKVLIAHGADLGIADIDDLKPIHVAAKSDAGNVIKEISQRIPGIDTLIQKLPDGSTPLSLAVSHGSQKALAELLQKFKDEGADVVALINEADPSGTTLLMDAVQKNSVAIVAILLAAGADINATDANGSTAAHIAAKHNAATSMKLLIEHGANLDVTDGLGYDPLYLAVSSDSGEVIEEIANSKYGTSLLSGGTDETSYLYMAIAMGKVNVVTVLLRKLQESRIDFAAELNKVNSSGITVLMKAAKGNSAAIVEALLAAGADINQANDEGETAVFHAVDNQSFDTLRILIEKNAQLNIQNSSGQTPLHLAAIADDFDMLKLLYDVDVNILDKNGQKAIEYIPESSASYKLLQSIGIRQQLLSCCEALKSGANATTLKLMNEMQQIIHTLYIESEYLNEDDILLLPQNGKINPRAHELLNVVAKCFRTIGPGGIEPFSKVYPDLQLQINSEIETTEFIHFKTALQQKLADLMKDISNRTPGSRFFIRKSINYELIEEFSKKIDNIESRGALLTEFNSLIKELVRNKSILYLTELSSFFDVNVKTVTENKGITEEQFATKISKELDTIGLSRMTL